VADPELTTYRVQVGELEGDGFGSAQATAVERAQKGGVAPPPGCRILAVACLRGRLGTGLEQPTQLVSRGVTAAGLGLTPHRLHVDRRVVLLETQEP
jgi:hypothetical protein